jgi:hypothetical protein
MMLPFSDAGSYAPCVASHQLCMPRHPCVQCTEQFEIMQILNGRPGRVRAVEHRPDGDRLGVLLAGSIFVPLSSLRSPWLQSRPHNQGGPPTRARAFRRRGCPGRAQPTLSAVPRPAASAVTVNAGRRVSRSGLGGRDVLSAGRPAPSGGATHREPRRRSAHPLLTESPIMECREAHSRRS